MQMQEPASHHETCNASLIFWTSTLCIHGSSDVFETDSSVAAAFLTKRKDMEKLPKLPH